jgi:hypothetical protein
VRTVMEIDLAENIEAARDRVTLLPTKDRHSIEMRCSGERGPRSLHGCTVRRRFDDLHRRPARQFGEPVAEGRIDDERDDVRCRVAHRAWRDIRLAVKR